MSELRAYLMGRKTFDPALDTATLVEEFVEGFYGLAAAPSVLSYMRIMRAAVTTHGGRDFTPGSVMYTNETVMNAAAAMTAAAKAVGGSEKAGYSQFHARVLRSSISIFYLVLLRWDDYVRFCQTEGRPWPLASTSKRAFFTEQFAVACNHTVSSTIAVPICAGWADPGPSGHHCWDLHGNITQFERYLFPS
jgi:hypothetical protein